MNRFHRPLVAALLALCASASFAARSIAPPSMEDEVLRQHQDDKHMGMTMWFSSQFMEQSAMGRSDPASVRRLVAKLDGYAIFAILDVKLDTVGGTIVPTDRDQMRASARLRLDGGAPLIPVPESELPSDVRSTVRVIKPVIAGMLGKFGDAMEFVVFKDADEHGKSRMTARAHLKASLTFDNESFDWALPSVSLLPPRVDTATGDTFPGDFDYSPFTGHKLDTRP